MHTILLSPARFRFSLMVLTFGALCFSPLLNGSEPPPVTPPPESFFQLVRENDREVAREFYEKYIDVNGLPVVASGEVDDRALQITYSIVTHMLAGRPDINEAMAENGMYLIIIGAKQLYTDMPEYRNHPNPDFMNERVRGTGGRPTSFGEENLLGLSLDRYDDESIAVHEFLHTIDSTLRGIDPTWTERRNAAYRNAMDNGLWTGAYATSNAGEYWGEIGQSYFDSNRPNNWNHNPVITREALKNYDPVGYELARTVFNLSPEQDWRYSFPTQQPSVESPPEHFDIDPYYTKFTWAREFTVLGREASDEALLKANDTIRKLFAYRHDILKALIDDGVRLVVLGENESIGDLPEYEEMKDLEGFNPLARILYYRPEAKLLVVGEENVMGDPWDPWVGESFLIRVMAKAVYEVTATRPVDPDWEDRGRAVQQYELRVKRLDIEFDERLEAIHSAAVEQGLWRGTPGYTCRVAYWADAVGAYFDARHNVPGPVGAAHPITTRKSLRDYDPDLYDLVRETMAYEGRVDWRFTPARFNR